MGFGKKIKELRKEKGFTQEELAEILNVSRSTISSWEIGRTYPDLEMLIFLSDTFDVSLDLLLKENEEVVDSIVTNNKINKYVKLLALFLLSCMTIFLLLNVAWFIKKENEYSFAKEWKGSGNVYTCTDKNIDCLVSKPNYLSFRNTKTLNTASKTKYITWSFSENKIYGKIYVEFSNGGSSSLIINNDFQFDEELNKEIGLSFSQDELEDISNYLIDNKVEIKKIYEESYSVWKDIK